MQSRSPPRMFRKHGVCLARQGPNGVASILVQCAALLPALAGRSLLTLRTRLNGSFGSSERPERVALDIADWPEGVNH
jgi:hypothetical protein